MRSVTLVVIVALFTFACSANPPPLVTTSEEATAIAVEQCGNEFHLGKPSGVHGSGNDWTVSWNGVPGQAYTAFRATIDGDLGVMTDCNPASQ